MKFGDIEFIDPWDPQYRANQAKWAEMRRRECGRILPSAFDPRLQVSRDFENRVRSLGNLERKILKYPGGYKEIDGLKLEGNTLWLIEIKMNAAQRRGRKRILGFNGKVNKARKQLETLRTILEGRLPGIKCRFRIISNIVETDELCVLSLRDTSFQLWDGSL
jgi:hypothetical protein